MSDETTSADGLGLGAMLDHLRLYGAAWCTEATFAAMCDVIEAARDAGPWPRRHGHVAYCDGCNRRLDTGHADECPDMRMAAALARLDAPDGHHSDERSANDG